MRTLVAVSVAVVVIAGCADLAADPVWEQASEPIDLTHRQDTVRMLFVGDIMMGRSIGPIVVDDPHGVFADVRFVVSDADVALFNLESPLTTRDHETENLNELEADPAAAELLAAAGFDIAGLANNHSGDTGREGIRDTLAALVGSGIRVAGVGVNGDAAVQPLLIDAGSLLVAVLAFDVTWQGPVAGDEPGIAEWNWATVEPAVTAALAQADVVVVGIHGGVEYRVEGGDPILDPAVRQLADLGVDIVWGHGPHVVQPIEVIEPNGSERATVAASSLGNFLFDQRSGDTASGAVLEVMLGPEGVIAYRVGRTDHTDLRTRFVGWDLPVGDAVAIEGNWWELVPNPDRVLRTSDDGPAQGFPYGDVFDSVLGDITGDGTTDVVVSYRAPFMANEANRGNREFYADSQGRAAHIGIFEASTWRKVWAAGTMQRPAAEVEACGRVLGIGYSTLEHPEVIAAGAAIWGGFGFSFMPDLEGVADMHCVDVDADAEPELIVTR